RLTRPQMIRLAILFGGLLVLVPMGIYTLAMPLAYLPASAGWFGGAFGAPLAAAFGWVGATLVVAFSLAGIFTATLGWDPIRSFATGRLLVSSGSRSTASLLAALRARLARYRAPA